DEFSLFGENLDEWGLPGPIPPVRRVHVAVDGLRQLSGLAWGDAPPELVLLHGGAQNAHTFDTVALALQRPLLALDLPGHGHSDTGPHGPSAIESHAADVAVALGALTGAPLPLVGMSLGGLTALIVAAAHPELVSALVLIDITPGVTPEKARRVVDFINGPATFEDFDAILDRTKAHNPTRSESSLRRGILHNAVQRDDGSWVWRHQRDPAPSVQAPPVGDLWARLEAMPQPVTLVRALGDGSMVDDADVAELMRRRPDARVANVAGSGHSVQGDAPLALAEILRRELD
ncbi:MAG TPA: alpha/beta fold hydrolase, partial [Acidimicrobiales bacterium]|nr:alpha/beta fold hydrolase [Acidimicrobiales bacterium]